MEISLFALGAFGGGIKPFNFYISFFSWAPSTRCGDTIWNMGGSLVLAMTTAIFHSIERTRSFLPAFEGAIYFIVV